MIRCRNPGRWRVVHKHDSGFVMILTAISMLFLVLLVGFGVDLGSWYLNASKLQRASDAAALAAAAALPDANAAKTAANDAYLRNGFQNGVNGITLATSVAADGVTTTVGNGAVPTYFLKLIMPAISISRTSHSMGSTTPALGSPFNVLGTGDLSIPGLPSPQNFWLAVNGVCSPKEDGDYFTARYDHNKGPFTSTLDANNDYIPAVSGKTHCPDPRTAGAYPLNPDYEGAGYSYFVDVPKPPASAGPNASVNVKIYDPALSGGSAAPPDYVDTLPQDETLAWGDFAYDLFDTNGTPQNPNDDTELIAHPYAMNPSGSAPPPNQWWTMYTIPYSEIANGGQFRVQVVPLEDYPQVDPDGDPSQEAGERGVNSFSIGAFASWESNGSVSACDTDNDASCPRVYGLNAVSVFNDVSGGAAGSSDDFYMADVTPQFVGQTFNIMLWDPAEGVDGIQLVAPDGTPLSFTYSSGGSSPGDVGPSSSGPVNIVDASATDGHAGSPPTLSNPYVFNDRLLTLTVTIPASYTSHVVGNDNWLRLRYVVTSASPNDRTTWGISIPGAGLGGPSHLTPPIP